MRSRWVLGMAVLLSLLVGCSKESPTEPAAVTIEPPDGQYSVSIVRLDSPLYSHYDPKEYAWLKVTRSSNVVNTLQDFEWQSPAMPYRLRIGFERGVSTVYAPIPLKCTEKTGNILVSVWNVSEPSPLGGSDTYIIWSRHYEFDALECFPTVN